MNLTGINQKNFEKWFFDYFERNLTSAEMKSVELFVEQYYEYKMEFQNWKSAYLKDNLTDTLPQEALSLMRPTNSGFDLHHLLDLSAFVFVVCLFSGKIFTGPPSNSYSQAMYRPIKQVYVSGKKCSTNSSTVFFEDISGKKVKRSSKDYVPEVIDKAIAATPSIADSPHEDSIISASGNQNVSISNDLSTTETLLPAEEEFGQEDIQKQQPEMKLNEEESINKKSKISGSVRRRINKNLRKADAQKKQHELLKGEEPYVVPINKDLF